MALFTFDNFFDATFASTDKRREIGTGQVKAIGSGNPGYNANFDGSENLGILVEGPATNRALNSALAAGGGGFTVANSAVVTTDGAVTNPDGTTGATLITDKQTTRAYWGQVVSSLSTSKAYWVYSFYAKKAPPVLTSGGLQNIAELCGIHGQINGTDFLGLIDLTNGQIKKASNSPFVGGDLYGIRKQTNGWWRVWVAIPASGVTSIAMRKQPAARSSTTGGATDASLFNGVAAVTNQTTAEGNAYFWGGQLEDADNPFPSSLVTTTTVAASRVANSLKVKDSIYSAYLPTGTLSVTAIAPDGLSSEVATVAHVTNGGSPADGIFIERSGTDAVARMVDQGVEVGSIVIGPWVSSTTAKIAVTWNNTTLSGSINGSDAVFDSISPTANLTGPSSLYIGHKAGNTDYFRSEIAKPIFYDGFASNPKLKELSE